jgi:hypothetical protein
MQKGTTLLAASPRRSEQKLNAQVFQTLERRLIVHSDTPQILEYFVSAYRRVHLPMPTARDSATDTGAILAEAPDHWLVFNGEPLPDGQEKPTTNFRLAFYGSSGLMRASFRANPTWHSLYAAALRLKDRAILVSAQSGIGKTTLALELMSRGAGFYSDEFAFIRKSDRYVWGLARALLIRERTLSIFDDARLRTVCEQSAPRVPHGDRVWDTIDPGDIFGEHIFAQPAPLAAAIMLERSTSATAAVTEVPAALAAADFTHRHNTQAVGFDRMAGAALMLAGTPCFRVAANSPRSAADAIEALLR